jgi:hypothetical protein
MSVQLKESDAEGDQGRIRVAHFYGSMQRARYEKSIFQRALTMLAQPAVFWSDAVWKKAGVLDTDLDLAMDYDLWVRMCRCRDVSAHVIDAVLAIDRDHGERKTCGANMGKINREKVRAYRKHFRSPWDGWKLLLARRQLMFKGQSDWKTILRKVGFERAAFRGGISDADNTPFDKLISLLSYHALTWYRRIAGAALRKYASVKRLIERPMDRLQT